ncbi:MAG: hypothetical protein ABIT83_06040 [Massilia sp.]
MNNPTLSAIPAGLRHYLLLWNSLVVLRHPGMVRRLKWAIPPLTALLIVISGLGHGAWLPAIERSMVLPLLVLMALGGIILVPGAVAMSTPSHALLVPHLRQRLIRLVLLFWIVSVPAAAYLILAGQMGWWAGTLYVGLLLVSLCASRAGRFRFIALPVQLSLTVGTMYFKHLPAGVAQFVFSDAGLAAGTLFLLAFGYLALRSLFPARGDGNVNPVNLASAFSIKTSMRMAGKVGRKLYAGALRRDCDGASAPRTLVMHLFGPMGHWSLALLSAAMLLGVALGAKLLMLAFAGATAHAMVAQFSWALALFFGPFGSVGSTRQMLSHLHASKVEQSLIRLAPRFPLAPSSFNRQLADGLLIRSLTDWALGTAALMLVVGILGGGFSALCLCAAVCAVGLPLPCVLLRDFARGKDHGALPEIGWFVLGAALIVALGVLASLAFGIAPPAGIVLAALPVSAALMLPRRRRMLAAPHAFPVERMA